MAVSLTPHGVLHFEETAAGALDPRVAEALRSAASEGSAALLLHLATRAMETLLPPPAAFWRRLARRYFTALCQTADLTEVTAIAPPTEAECELLVETAPPMTGAEYLRPETLQALWQELDTHVRREMGAHAEGAQAWLKARHPLWNLVGRVTFHLAENKRDPEFPFAFLATYTHRISETARPQYLPLGRALQEYAGTQNRSALLSLLAPVQRAAEKSGLVRELTDSQRIFQPQRWTPREAHRFLQDIPHYEASGLLVRVPDWFRGGRAARPGVRVTIGAGKPAGSGLGSLLDFDATLALDGETLTAEDLQQIAAAGEGLVQIRGKWVEVDHARIKAVLEHWRRLERARREEGVSFAEGMRLLAGGGGSGGVGEDAVDPGVREWSHVTAGAWLTETLAALRDPSAFAVDAPPPGLRATLRPYQQAGVHWLRFVTGLGLGACLADDMGLGKTIQVLGALLHWRAEHPEAAPALLVLPASLLGNWIAEAERFAPTLRVFAVHPSELDPAALAALGADPARGLAGRDLVLTTYAMLLKQPWISAREWGAVILDEAQAIKNPGARQTRAAKALRGAMRVALTGTPVENSLADLWSIFDFLNPGLLGPAAQFSRAAKKWTAESSADGEAFSPLRRLVRPYILRRLKSDRSVISDLPDKTELRTFCSLTKRQAALYAESVGELSRRLAETEAMQRRGLILAFLTRFKQLCNHPAHWLGTGEFTPGESGKFLRLGELAAEFASRQERVLVFTQFREMTAPLADFLGGVFGAPGLTLHGGTEVKERRGLVERFQREDGPPFFILSVKAGGTGLTLTQAQHVVHFDRWWNPAVENQATDRAYRIGQRRNVLVHKFVCRGTVEEKIDAMIESKQSLATGVLGGAREIALTEMKDDDLMRFVSLDLAAAVGDE